MKPNDLPTATPWTMARRAARMNPSVIREILKITEKPGIISFAGGLPSAKTFPIAEFTAACNQVLTTDPQAALQYAASEGYNKLIEAIRSVKDLGGKVLVVSPDLSFGGLAGNYEAGVSRTVIGMGYVAGVAIALLALHKLWRILTGSITDAELIGVVEDEDLPHPHGHEGSR